MGIEEQICGCYNRILQLKNKWVYMIYFDIFILASPNLR